MDDRRELIESYSRLASEMQMATIRMFHAQMETAVKVYGEVLQAKTMARMYRREV